MQAFCAVGGAVRSADANRREPRKRTCTEYVVSCAGKVPVGSPRVSESGRGVRIRASGWPLCRERGRAAADSNTRRKLKIDGMAAEPRRGKRGRVTCRGDEDGGRTGAVLRLLPPAQLAAHNSLGAAGCGAGGDGAGPDAHRSSGGSRACSKSPKYWRFGL